MAPMSSPVSIRVPAVAVAVVLIALPSSVRTVGLVGSVS